MTESPSIETLPDLPVTIIGGYLGAGKTTLVNQLLRQADGKRIAVLVNDFGDVSIDADLIESSTGQVLNLAGGCVCCSIGSDLVATLSELRAQLGDIDHVLLETSGVAMPGVVAATVGLSPKVRRDAVVVVCDASNGLAWLRDQYIGDTVARQIAAADLLLISKQTLVSETERAQFATALTNVAPHTPQLPIEGQVLSNLILGRLPKSRTSTRTGLSPRPISSAADNQSMRQKMTTSGEPAVSAQLGQARYVSRRFSSVGPVDIELVVTALGQPGLQILRAKGILSDLHEQQWLIQCVGRRVEHTRWHGAAKQAGELIVISVEAQNAHEAVVSASIEQALTAIGMVCCDEPLALK